ncbi:paraquat-inducible protein B [Acetobacter nitrogenifigens DSM 23921 = NBRC 105050]|uniref:Mammalian cell entry protein n=1 Tax=Acetobacter nitrogenifigens DSM 23921 = NBRC 105050 TaxID=1120919 RepID=A0A511X6U7_9PROT|nr:MlaD family protein [Acetobacter nitrogenifigens]GBQ98800.1 paraquat-inducible protein B [Acetobacter nitrogenifigens DSM 23921 = NBRC 105050]GEN58645.1 mammalian cell entry protein [Acetobacter nitrogenifigens DSM 23921 = NBRC 105050]
MTSDNHNQPHTPGGAPPDAPVGRAWFSLIWLIPIMSVLIAGFLLWRNLYERGPEILITLDTADGLTSGQTQVKNKSVTLGTVSSISLSKDMRHVDVRVQMNSDAAPLLTDNSQFWVVRPRINGASVTGLETLMSGAYIGFDPGAPGGQRATHFKGLESPPGIQSDQPGRTYSLLASAVGSIGPGAPVFFRDVDVGEVLGYTLPPGGVGPVLIQFFVREPYDHYLRTDTRFWNVSGVKVGFGAGGLKVQLQSIQALFSGGVAFGLSKSIPGEKVPEAPANTLFQLYDDKETADTAGYRAHQTVVTYLASSVSGLTAGSAVTMFGIQVGSVTSVKLDLDQNTGHARVRVAMDIQPERVLPADQVSPEKVITGMQALVANGLRASTDSASLLTGETVIAFNFVKNATQAKTYMEGDALVIPGEAGGMSGIMQSLSVMSDKLAALPIEQIGAHANDLIAHADERINSPEVKQSLVNLRDSLRSLHDLLDQTNRGVQPLLKRLPEMSDQLDNTLKNANKLLASYGGDTDFHRSLQSMVVELQETARSLKFMSNFLTNHPSALIAGRK